MADVDVDAPTFTRTVRRAQELLAVVYDRLTGENAETDTINNRGAWGRGALLPHPIVQQELNAPWSNVDTYMKTGSGRMCPVVMPIWLPPGEEIVDVFVDARVNTTYRPTANLTNAAGTFSSWQTPIAEIAQGPDGEIRMRFLFQLAGSISGVLYLRVMMPDDFTEMYGGTLSRFTVTRVTIPRYRPQSGQPASSIEPARTPGNVPAQVYKTHPQTSPVPWRWRDIDDAMLGDSAPISSWALDAINRNANTLHEALTGTVIQGNRTINLADSGVENPAVSRFFAKTARGFVSEPGIAHNVWTACFGGIRENGAFSVNSSLTEGSVNWFAPHLDYSSSPPGSSPGPTRIAWSDYVMMPDAKNNTASLNVLVASPAGTHADWEFLVDFNGASSAWLTPGGITSLPGFYRCLFTGLSFLPDRVNEMVIAVRKKSNSTAPYDDLAVVGANLWIDS